MIDVNDLCSSAKTNDDNAVTPCVAKNMVLDPNDATPPCFSYKDIVDTWWGPSDVPSREHFVSTGMIKKPSDTEDKTDDTVSTCSQAV